VEAWYNKGFVYQKRMDIANLIIAYRKVIEFGDASQQFVITANSFIKDIEKQVKNDLNLSLDEFLWSMKNFSDAYAAMEKMEWKKAIFGFNKVLTKDPKHTQSYGNMGLCYAHLGEKQKALNNLNKALELDPNYGPVLSNLSVISSLKDGEKLPPSKYKSVDYYKDIALNEKKQVNK
jgi:tetratricopeptide (TPR) repeat protein